MIKVEQPVNLFYVAFDEEFQYQSSGILFVSRHKGEDWVKLNYNYLLLFKDLEAILESDKDKWQSQYPVRFIAKDLHRLYDQRMLNRMVRGEDHPDLGRWWMNRY